MKRNDELRGHLSAILRDWTFDEVLESLAAEAAYWKRQEGPGKAAAWDRVRAMILKAAAVTKEVGL